MIAKMKVQQQTCDIALATSHFQFSLSALVFKKETSERK